MFVVAADFSGDIKISTTELIPGFEQIIDRTETKYLKMMLGGKQFSEMVAALADEESADYDKWNKFLRGTTYNYSNIDIKYEGAIQFLRYFCFVDLMQEQPFTAGSEIYSREITSAKPLAGIARQTQLNEKFNEGVRYYIRSYFYICDTPDFTFERSYYNRLLMKSIYSGITL